MPHGRPNARVHLVQIEDQKFSHALLDAPEGVGAGCVVFVYGESAKAWLPYRVRAGVVQQHAIPLTRENPTR